MLRDPCYIFSDTHLGAAEPGVEPLVRTFLKHLHGRAGSLVINGDLFEFWFEWRRVIPRTGFRVIAALADLIDAGVDVLWIAGNHDCWGGEMLRREVGLTYHVGPWHGSLAGWRTLIEHGDGLRPVEDRKYRALRAVIRHPVSVWAFKHLLHPDWGSSIAAGTGHASRTYRAGDGGVGLRRIAQARLEADKSLELVLFGHSHVAALERMPTGGVYANSGSWMQAPTYLKVDPDRISLLKWTAEPSAEGERLDALDRRPQEALPKA